MCEPVLSHYSPNNRPWVQVWVQLRQANGSYLVSGTSWMIGRRGDYSVPSEESVGGLPTADVHDAGRRHSGGESGQRVAGAESSRTAAEVEWEAVEERDRF